jgi:predicted aspartyl protease
VDTGASYARLPRPLLERLGVPPQERETFILGDDRRVEYDVGQTQIRVAGRTRYSMVIFGEERWEPLLGAITLQEFGLGVDPFHERLIPVPGLLM